MDIDSVFKFYATQIPEIDRDHLELILQVEYILDLSKKKEYESAKPFLMKFLQDQKDHFAEEEALMQKIQFPFFVYHAKDHEKVISEIGKFIQCFGNSCMQYEASKLVRLVLEHIDHYDLQYVPYYKIWLASQEQTTKIPT